MKPKISPTIAALSFVILLQVVFLNCSRTQFDQSGNNESAQTDSGNGGNYDGKISYVLSDLNHLCADGNPIQARIVRSGAIYLLVRENCTDLTTPRNLDSASVSLDTTGIFLTYQGQKYLKVRDPWLQPFSSLSLWNTSIGSDAQWSGETDADTLDVRHSGSGISAGQWSVPYFLAQKTDPVKTVHDQDGAYPVADQLLNFPADFHFSLPSGGSNAFVLMEPSRRWLFHYAGCQETAQGLSCAIGEKSDTCGDGLGNYDLGSGLIRAWELQSGEIKHMLRYALPTTLNKSGPTWQSGLAWPATHEDYNGPTTYSGNVLFGSTVGIPATVNINSLGLSAGGQILAKALQDYGALQRDNTGGSGIVFYAEESAEAHPRLNEMRADLDKIVPLLKILRNQAPQTPNGGGVRRHSELPPVDPVICQ
jgi:hypothetical protein